MNTLRMNRALIAFGTHDYECSTSGAITLVHPYTGERKPIVNCEANRPTILALYSSGWLDDDEMSVIGKATQTTPPDNTGSEGARSQDAENW